MKMKILLGSIGAVVILILVSFTNVVGFQSTTSRSVNQSPLFNIRTQKAINKESKALITSDYLGKGNELRVFIPSSNNERMLLHKAIDRLQGIDDETFTKFLEKALYWLTIQDKYKDVNIPQLIFTLHQIKENPKRYEHLILNNNQNVIPAEIPTIDVWIPGCFLLVSIALILGIQALILFVVFVAIVLFFFIALIVIMPSAMYCLHAI